MSKLRRYIVCIACLVVSLQGYPQKNVSLKEVFSNPPESAKPWVLWYWMHAAVSKEGITADLEAMQSAGIKGAYLVCIYDTVAKIPFDKPARQLAPEWWGMVNHAMKECKRLGLQLAFHVSDGFALAGGPWIKPEQSMQKIVWTKTYVKGGVTDNIVLEQPEAKEGFYKDIAVYAYPANSYNAFSETVMVPNVTTSSGEKAAWLAFKGDGSKTFKSDTACWIQYKYPRPFTLRSLQTHTGGNNYQAQRFIIFSSNDGIDFKEVIKLQPPRHGWQDSDEGYTFSIPSTTAKYFRFVWSKEGTEPGSEDLDAAKWKPSLKIKGIYLSDEPVINQFEAKNGSMWRVAENTTAQMVGKEEAVAFKDIINLTDKMDEDGNVSWKPASGNWVVVRVGHTSTGHTNATGGAAKGLECDKFDAQAIQLQFNNWFAKAFENTDPGLAKQVLKIFYIDSWEAGSQNWSKTFAGEFKRRRGYDLLPYLLIMTGTPIDDAATSEKILHDVRETIAELVNDVFYNTLRQLADEKKLYFTAESVAPTMLSDGLLHYKTVDYPTGEFWLNSPTHDKPNDMFDAISAAHIYGKNIVQAEAFTNLRIGWNEYPGNIKTVGDRAFAMGINRFIIHVMAHNPWLNRKPGMTLGTVGLFFQRDQTWFHQSKAWIEYLTRTAALLQQGKPVADIAVFIGEEVPRRSILPDRLVNTLPGIFGKERVDAEKQRLENNNQPQRSIPDGVGHSANMADPEHWVNALRGYQYDCFNPDALIGAKVVNGKVIFQSGAAYSILVFPGKLLMNPNSNLMSLPVAKKILELLKAGATIIMDKAGKQPIGFTENDKELQKVWTEVMTNKTGKLIATPYMDETFAKLGVARDLDVAGNKTSIAWTHRKLNNADVYFISNTENLERVVELSFRVSGCVPELYDAVTGNISLIDKWKFENGRTWLSLSLAANGAAFVVFQKKPGAVNHYHPVQAANTLQVINYNWKVKFNQFFGGPKEEVDFPSLSLWNENANDAIKYYSGTAIYQNSFSVGGFDKTKPVYLTMDSIFNIASVNINGINCGTIWTPPYKLDITKALKQGINRIEISVSNTWANRLISDQLLPINKRITWTTAPAMLLEGKSLLPAGLLGNIKLVQ